MRQRGKHLDSEQDCSHEAFRGSETGSAAAEDVQPSAERLVEASLQTFWLWFQLPKQPFTHDTPTDTHTGTHTH